MIEFCPVARGLAEDAGLIQKAVDRVLRSGRLILGPEVEAFEREWAEWTGARFCIGVASGTDALKIALRACGIGANRDEAPWQIVQTQANSAPATASAICEAGGYPHFLDINDSGQIYPSDDHCDATVPVALYGLLPQVNMASRRMLVWDLAQKHDRAVWTDIIRQDMYRPEGRQAACHSFYPTKALGAIGDGGAIVTDSERIAAACRELRQYGCESTEVVGRAGWNSRLDEVQAAILRERLRLHPRREAHRTALAAIYRERAKADGWETRLVAGSHIVAGMFPDRGAAQTALADVGIGTRIHYRVPLHQHPAYAHARYVELPGTERWCRETLSLPYSNWTTEAEARTAAEAASRIVVLQMEAEKR